MIIGVDLGTTNSLAAIWRDGKSELIPNALGHSLTPSCVSMDTTGEMLVGLPARDRLMTHPQSTIAAFKRYMGTKKEIELAGKRFRPEELSALVLKSLKADAETYMGEPVSDAIITVPAYFNDTQRKATRLAGELAGLNVVRLLNEPTAAALAYGLYDREAECQFLVFDLGGGTFDISILEMFSGVMEVRASAGDNHLGGEDFDTVLVEGFLETASKEIGLVWGNLNANQQARLRVEAERVKRALSSQDKVDFVYEYGEHKFTWTVTTEMFESLAMPLLKRLRAPIERALRDSKLRVADLAEIVLVGGATRMPIVHRLVAKMLGRFPRRDIHPDEAIAMGAGVQVGLKMRDVALDDMVMTDVCPFTLGVDIAEKNATGHYRSGIFLPIIERNTVIPCSRSHLLSPTEEFQKIMALRIFQGESRDVKDNVPLGKLDVPLIVSRNKEDDRTVDVRFTYDVNGLLEVEATVLATQKKYALVIEKTPGAMTPEEIQLSLAKLKDIKISPRDQTENKALLARLGRLYEQHLGDVRQIVNDWLKTFEDALEKQDPDEIAAKRAMLNQYADDLEGHTVL
jgi:molecular chaperone HscC